MTQEEKRQRLREKRHRARELREIARGPIDLPLLVLVLMAVVLAAGSGGMRKKCDVCWPGRHPSLSGQHIKRR